MDHFLMVMAHLVMVTAPFGAVMALFGAVMALFGAVTASFGGLPLPISKQNRPLRAVRVEVPEVGRFVPKRRPQAE